ARLAKLEAEVKERERSSAAATAPNPAPGAMIAADGIKLAELRARAASLEDMTKELQKKLFAARLEEGKALDPNEKMKLQRKSIDIQSEWTRRGLDFRKLKDEIAALEGKAAPVAAPVAANVPPVAPKPKPEKTSPNFEDAANVALVGTVIRSFKAPSPIACRDACDADATCTAYQHGKKAANMGQCELFSAVTGRNEDQNWRSGVRKAGAQAALSAAKRAFPVPISRMKQGFAFYEHLSIDGEHAKSTRADSEDGCMVVCRNTAGCIAARYINRDAAEDIRQQALASFSQCIAYRSLGDVNAQHGVTAIIRTTEP
ncbi:MAG: PAN domain-containing protein, partial [Hyphomicrobium sp.]